MSSLFPDVLDIDVMYGQRPLRHRGHRDPRREL